jgi:tetratricopeptide (TPR) repeat protein
LCVAAAAVLWIVGLSLSASAQMRYWENGLTLWTRALSVTSQNFVAEDNMGAELIKTGNVSEARTHFQAAAAINPQDPFSQLDIGVCDKRLGNLDGAISHYEAALRLSTAPTLRSTAFTNLGSIYRLKKNYPLARTNYLSALQIEPANLTSLLGMGLVEQRSSNVDRSIDYYSRAAAAQPSNISYLLLAQALQQAGRNEDAAVAFKRAQQSPGDIGFANKEVTRLLSE